MSVFGSGRWQRHTGAFSEGIRKALSSHPCKWTSHSFDSILSALLDNPGVSVLSQRVALPYVQQGELHEIDISDMSLARSFSLVHHKSKYLTNQMKSLIHEFTEEWSYKTGLQSTN
ncbi:MAG: hypothetical protein H2212_16350 [Ruminococcus sp.]|nr:hypothetical protein [Ruminococcus sp.]